MMNFRKLLYQFTFLLLTCTQAISINAQNLVVPNARQVAWQQAELGVVFHYDLHVFDGKKYSQTRNRLEPMPDIQIFNPEKLNVEQWVLSAKAMGAKFAIITATHETGFAIFPSKYNPYNVSQLSFKDGKADLLKDFVEACRKHGIKPGVYVGIRWNSFFGVHDFKVDGTGQMQKNRQEYYNRMAEGMVQEICTNYGELFEIWFDGGASHPDKGAPNVLPIVQKYQPNCLFYHNDQLAEARWAGSESGTVGYPNWSTFTYNFTGSGESAPKPISENNYYLLKHGDPEGKYFVPAMSDAPLRGANGRHEWFWEPGDENSVYPLNELVDMYCKSVGRNSTLIMGITPDNTGLVPKGDAKRMEEFGEKIKTLFDIPLAKTQTEGKQARLQLKGNKAVNYIMIQEDIALGHRISEFIVEAKIGKQWKEIDRGTAVGHKYIKKLAQTCNAKEFRLTVLQAKATPKIINFSIYDTE
ncbi:alpha-L-fucosidase [Sphingobacterium nematocida]|nr:alpha-L-fucosidase [Sphingobacterium nematocida]